MASLRVYIEKGENNGKAEEEKKDRQKKTTNDSCNDANYASQSAPRLADCRD